ncbi:hypothetical protein RhiirC2_789643 [Rhizophagus irregularis]|uniref:HAT C-terminal dimerisation domain-containing protein n=1 Tax=Rhizophagus irregularis TaxID=588596 RepID=A0A2N1MMQ8_9GLOM|nr:hypothetical protein RhiirC2_789643 [Rhizophagus irregularis]
MEIIAILSVNYVTDIQKELYNKYYSIMVLCETRWNSHFYCFKSLIQSKQALRNLAIRHERSQSTPAEANFEDYRQKIEPFDDETFGQFGGDVFKFWKYIEGDYKELASIALRIFGICVNAASVERMWTSMGFLHMNRLLSMSKLRASINFSFRKKELQKNEVEFFDLNTKPVDDSAENLQKNPIDDEEITGDENIITSER